MGSGESRNEKISNELTILNKRKFPIIIIYVKHKVNEDPIMSRHYCDSYTECKLILELKMKNIIVVYNTDKDHTCILKVSEAFGLKHINVEE